LPSPAWSYFTVHVPPPLVIVNVAPLLEQLPPLLNATAFPDVELAATEKVVPKTALVGACVVTEMVWFAFEAATLRVTLVAAV
jgi:hypothetical protein